MGSNPEATRGRAMEQMSACKGLGRARAGGVAPEGAPGGTGEASPPTRALLALGDWEEIGDE